MDLSEQPVLGATQRRRQRRLRSWLRHERMTVAMAVAERTHHSSRGQTIARAGVWRHELNFTGRDRRLRMHWRHEQLTLQMVLATVQHQSYGAQRGQCTATRTERWGREMNFTATIRDPPTPQLELFSFYDEEPSLPCPGRRSWYSG